MDDLLGLPIINDTTRKVWTIASAVYVQSIPQLALPILLCANVLELPVRVDKVVRIGLDSNLAGIGLLYKVLVPLLVCESDGVLLCLEVDVRSLHIVSGRLPAHQRVLPSVALGKDIPVHAPALASPFTGLSGRFGLLVDAAIMLDLPRLCH
jgi:hypothetical protein